jgi:hypothetical protein
VGPRTGLNEVERRTFLPLTDSNSAPLAVPSVANRYTTTVPSASQSIYLSFKCYRSVQCAVGINSVGLHVPTGHPASSGLLSR